MLKPEEIQLRHRDLNWLSFNERVLQEAQDPSTPLYERLKFLAIFSMNLDEYFRVRVSQLRQIKRVKKSIRKKLMLRPNKTIKEILNQVKEQQDQFGKIYKEKILPELEKKGISIIHFEEFNKTQREFAYKYFFKIKDCVRSQVIHPDQEAELFLENNLLYLIVTFKDEDNFGILNVPVEECGRFVTFSSKTKVHKITFLDDLIKANVREIFEGHEVEGVFEIKDVPGRRVVY